MSSACLFVCDVGMDCDHIGWNSSGIISPLVSLECSLSADPNIRGLLQREHPDIAAEWLQIALRSQWIAYRKPPSLFRMVQSLTPYYLPFPQHGCSICPQDTRMAISATGNPIHFMFGSRVLFSGSADRMALCPVTSNPCWRHAAGRHLG